MRAGRCWSNFSCLQMIQHGNLIVSQTRYFAQCDPSNQQNDEVNEHEYTLFKNWSNDFVPFNKIDTLVFLHFSVDQFLKRTLLLNRRLKHALTLDRSSLALWISPPIVPFRGRKNEYSAQRGWRPLAHSYHSRNRRTGKRQRQEMKLLMWRCEQELRQNAKKEKKIMGLTEM